MLTLQQDCVNGADFIPQEIWDEIIANINTYCSRSNKLAQITLKKTM